MSGKVLLILVLLTAAVLIAALAVRSPSNPALPLEGELYFPELLERTNDIERAVIRNHIETTTLEHVDGSWIVVEKDQYPADIEKIRQLILGLARLTRVEGKTTNPALYSKLGLEDITRPESRATLIELFSDSNHPQAELYLGKRREAQGGSTRREYYVRTKGDPQAWLVAGSLPDQDTGWLDTALFDADVGEIKSVSLSQSENSWVIVRPDESNGEFILKNLTADESTESQFALGEITRRFTALNFDDVRPANSNDNGVDFAMVTAHWFSGLEVKMIVQLQDGSYVGRLSADYRPGDEPDAAVAAISDGWNALWAGREFVLPKVELDNIIVSRDQLTTSAEKTPG